MYYTNISMYVLRNSCAYMFGLALTYNIAQLNAQPEPEIYTIANFELVLPHDSCLQSVTNILKRHAKTEI